MKWFAEILREFKSSQRIFVLVLLMITTLSTLVISNYFKYDDCRELINENIQLQDDLVYISSLIRELRREHIVHPMMPPPTESSKSLNTDTVSTIYIEPNLEYVDGVVLDELFNTINKY